MRNEEENDEDPSRAGRIRETSDTSTSQLRLELHNEATRRENNKKQK
jgi:hypothetical protein